MKNNKLISELINSAIRKEKKPLPKQEVKAHLSEEEIKRLLNKAIRK